jgi:hypothetical protein
MLDPVSIIYNYKQGFEEMIWIISIEIFKFQNFFYIWLQNFHFLCGSVIHDCYNYSMPEKLHTLLKLKVKGHLRQV